ncbi:MAG: ergothioneine biosynthesis protein EgtB [Pseudomonadales bacterium]
MSFSRESLGSSYLAVRQQSLDICEPLEIEDYLVQPMDDASPPKWHLAHVTWFFETFLLKPFVRGYQVYDDAYEVLFNSYYNGVGEQYPRSKRGLLSRPTLDEVLEYRRHVDEHMLRLIDSDIDQDQQFRIALGLHHEQQHQELLFTDIKYNLGNNPLCPPYRSNGADNNYRQTSQPLNFVEYEGGIFKIGVPTDSISGLNFAFDNESPRHDILVRDFAISDRLITNGEFLEFIEDGGYQRPELWLSDAWSMLKARSDENIPSPLYWFKKDSEWFEYTLDGVERLAMNKPVCHVSGYEAEAFASWKGMRLPTEQEWEVMAGDADVVGNFVDSGALHPEPVSFPDKGVRQVFGDVWEWTQSSYGPYPGFKPFAGALGEYNGKFMANQLVLRGGSCVTPASHIRRTYRNFFYPEDCWQFTGIRLASVD